ncbi:MAG TPA: TetR/AcrR family transcriptional regulator [Candidatus Dormibacteraeota bacterium]|nr:TetR/AcrR family transcriptional regulator [Candidatus Dormibacteraeota bacterium]
MPRPRTHDEALRLRLLDEGGRLLAAEGPGALTTRRLAERAGTSSSAVYSLFGDKSGLLRAMFLEGFRRLARRFAELPRTDDPGGDLIALGRAFRANALANPHLYDLMFRSPFPGLDLGGEECEEALATFQVLVSAVRRCVERKAIAPADPEDVARVLFGLVDGLAGLELRGWLGDLETAGRCWELALSAVLRGLQPSRGEGTTADHRGTRPRDRRPVHA